MAKEVISRCDECGSTEDTEEFTIIRNGQKKDVDLCGEHKAPLVKLYELGATSPTRRGRPAAHSVVAIEDWKPED